ncbi:MAG: hypothetical protein LUD47_06765 [Clostridia bacterium]|nr:hypothetical protein [Clostridia bacterium]
MSGSPLIYVASCVTETDNSTGKVTKTVGTHVTDLPAPSKYELDIEDVSASDSGRTEDTVMGKGMLGTCTSLSLTWNYLTSDDAHRILEAFKHEYIWVKYFDIEKGEAGSDYMRDSEFYVGNRSASLYNSQLNLWSSISFKIIERSAKNLDEDEDMTIKNR